MKKFREYRKKPIVVEAIQWDGSNASELLNWALEYNVWGDDFKIDREKETVHIATLEGYTIASVGDWVIKGVRDEFYSCKPDIFEMTYEKVYEGA